MTKIGLITCSNATQDLGCSSLLCLKGIHASEGAFAEHKDNGGAQLIGIINCAGCPTMVAPDKILNRVRILAELGAEAIHLSSCLMALCPFKRKYEELLKSAFPEVKIIPGSHGGGEAELEMFKKMAHDLLCQPQMTMADAFKERQRLTAENS